MERKLNDVLKVVSVSKVQIIKRCLEGRQLASQTDILRAATASGGDLVEYFVDDDDEMTDDWKQN